MESYARTVPQPTLIIHMTHIGNLDAIFGAGALLAISRLDAKRAAAGGRRAAQASRPNFSCLIGCLCNS